MNWLLSEVFFDWIKVTIWHWFEPLRGEDLRRR